MASASRRLAAPAGSWGRPAFTLMEMLVSLAVVFILIVLAAAPITRAKEQARLTLCRNALRSLGMSILSYAQDNGDRLPVDDRLDNPHVRLISALKACVPDPRTYYCPSLNQGDSCFSPDNLQGGRIGYFYYSCQQAPNDPAVSTFLRWQVAWPRRLALDMDGDCWVASDQWFSGERTCHRYYGKGVNYLVLAGGVRFVEDSPRQQFK